MASDDKKTKTPASKTESPKESKAAEAAPKTDAKTEAKSDAKPDAKGDAKSDAKPDAAPSNYSRGEGQKVVTQAYKDNWNAIYGKKEKKKR